MDQGGDIKTKVGDKQYSSVVLFKEGFTAVPSDSRKIF